VALTIADNGTWGLPVPAAGNLTPQKHHTGNGFNAFPMGKLRMPETPKPVMFCSSIKIVIFHSRITPKALFELQFQRL
jgi:hypothetical protein